MKIKKVLFNFIYAILIFIIIILLYAFAQVNMQNKDYANIFGFSIFQVATGSMEPTIKVDDFVIVKLNSKINKDDIITYKKDGEYITHRLIYIDGDNVIAQGDYNSSADEPVPIDDVIGKVIYIVKDVAIWKKVFTEKSVVISLAVTASLFIIMILYQDRNCIQGKEE